MYTNPYLTQQAYNPYAPQTAPLRPSYVQPQSNNIVWVQGVEGAKAYQIPPNTNVILLDSENDSRFYIKSADNVGMCSMRVFEYSEVVTSEKPQPELKLDEYVKKDELKGMILDLIANNMPVTHSTPVEQEVVESEQIVPTIKRSKADQYIESRSNFANTQ